MDWAVIIAFIGGLSGSIITVIGNAISKRQENHHAFRLAVLDSAFKEYEIRNARLEKMNEAGRTVVIYPWDFYVLCYGKILKTIDKKNYSKADVEKMFRELEEIQSVYNDKNNIPNTM